MKTREKTQRRLEIESERRPAKALFLSRAAVGSPDAADLAVLTLQAGARVRMGCELWFL